MGNNTKYKQTYKHWKTLTPLKLTKTVKASLAFYILKTKARTRIQTRETQLTTPGSNNTQRQMLYVFGGRVLTWCV